ncbi:cytochrome c-type biogenesis protein [Phyllobacterium zundukense]|uniref:Cytochrome c-type biogenesis protein n=1 Tax=Phyllobacterium zundukense TaxID=1867719 RepID=A0A2N9VQZ9_9HYPH|nr:cytochrome c-type biogenesis protein [Phyllobacterium zundukense]ATU92351.1 cytochrome c-type biogenesis protein CcmH [Phyllobacterium zundukense]PIO41917.1 cytochrome c-type biogenesis protein CcmH [Phyllobacterium zundukense]
MRRYFSAAVLGLALCFAASGARAVAPDEMLANPALEKRARTISAELRCMVCQNESIDDSNADLAKDLRLLVRERLVAGDTDEQVLDFLVARYGEFVLLKPRLQMSTILLWGFPIGALVIGGTAIVIAIRRRRVTSVETAPLSESEKNQLKKLFTASGD